jgi:membrane protease YdiL (CAAX protease family)
MPVIMVVSYGVMRLMGLPLPAQPRVPLLAAPVLFVVYFVAAAGEETGWMGYAVDPMQDRWSALKTSLVLGSGWAVWHVTLYAQAHHDLAWIAWQSFSLVAVRLLIVWLYNNTGKAVLAAIVFHDMMNVSQGLFPNSASHYDPAVTAPIIVIAAVIVTFLWGAKTLARYRYTTAALPGRFEEASK